MINASRVAMEFASLLPSREVPENTEGYEGFAHLNNMEGDVEHAHLHYIIRDHDRDLLEARKDKFNLAAEFINRKYGVELVKVTLKDAYSNMKEMILPHQEILDVARAAMRKNGVEPVTTPIRGGTRRRTPVLYGSALPEPLHRRRACTRQKRICRSGRDGDHRRDRQVHRRAR